MSIALQHTHINYLESSKLKVLTESISTLDGDADFLICCLFINFAY